MTVCAESKLTDARCESCLVVGSDVQLVPVPAMEGLPDDEQEFYLCGSCKRDQMMVGLWP